MKHLPALHCLAAAAALALVACGDRDANQVPETVEPPPPVDTAVPGAPEGVLPAPSPTAPMSPEEATAAHFGKLDANGDGKVTPEEHAQGAAAMFKAMDANADGNVTAAEMDAAQAALGGDARMASVDKIKAIDTNGDGVLSADEHASGSRTMFATMDTNADGTLDMGEVRAGHDAMMGKPAQ